MAYGLLGHAHRRCLPIPFSFITTIAAKFDQLFLSQCAPASHCFLICEIGPIAKTLECNPLYGNAITNDIAPDPIRTSTHHVNLTAAAWLTTKQSL